METSTEAVNNETVKEPKNQEIQENIDKLKHTGDGSQCVIQNQYQLAVVADQKTPSKIMPSTSLPTTSKETTITNLPSTSTSFSEHMIKEKGIVVPSPFKRALFWPESTTGKKRRITKEKLPSAITSQAWRHFHEKKESEKKAKEEAKEQRKQKLQEKRELKEVNKKRKDKNVAQKKPTGCKQNIKKRRRLSDTSSETSDSDVTYAETGESDFEVQSDNEDIPLTYISRQLNNKDTQSKMNLKERNTTEKEDLQTSPAEPVENIFQKDAVTNIQENTQTHLSKDLEAGSESPKYQSLSKVVVEELPQVEPVIEENLYSAVPCTIFTKQLLQEQFTINDYVLVTWNERPYPGQIIDECQEGVLVSCMKKAKGFWHWPAIKDIQLYHRDKVVCQIGIPKFVKKGCFIIPEMDNL